MRSSDDSTSSNESEYDSDSEELDVGTDVTEEQKVRIIYNSGILISRYSFRREFETSKPSSKYII